MISTHVTGNRLLKLKITQLASWGTAMFMKKSTVSLRSSWRGLRCKWFVFWIKTFKIQRKQQNLTSQTQSVLFC